MVLPVVEGMSASLQWVTTSCSAVRVPRAWCDFPVPGDKAEKSVTWNTEVKESTKHSSLWCWTIELHRLSCQENCSPEKCSFNGMGFFPLDLIEDRMPRDKRLSDKKTAVIKRNQFLFPVTHRATGTLLHNVQRALHREGCSPLSSSQGQVWKQS